MLVPDEDVDGTRKSKEVSPATRATLRWLVFVFFETLALLVFQLGLGYAARSISLVADSAHSSVDVISYGLNFAVESLKVRAESEGRAEAAETPVASLATRIDTGGAGLSVLALGLATAFAVKEAVNRLYSNEPAEDAADFDRVGPALFAFAVVSTAANVAALVLYLRWHAAARGAEANGRAEATEGDGVEFACLNLESSVAAAPADVPVPEPPAPPPPPPSFPSRTRRALRSGQAHRQTPAVEMEESLLSPEVPAVPTGSGPLTQVNATPMLVLAGREVRATKRATARSGGLNLRANFAGLDDVEAARGGPVPCRDAGCCDPGCNTGSGGNASTWASMLHMLVHPGCQGHGEEESNAAQRGAGMSLNVGAAMLHLVADVLRGITMLVAALIIQLGVSKDPGKVDAVCALLVAAFIFMGAGTILQKLCRTAWRDCFVRGGVD